MGLGKRDFERFRKGDAVADGCCLREGRADEPRLERPDRKRGGGGGTERQVSG